MECFAASDGGKNGVLYNAVRDYLGTDAAKKADVKFKYGDSINDWCVKDVTDFSYIFDGLGTFNEAISKFGLQSELECLSTSNRPNLANKSFLFFSGNWDTGSATNMSYMVSLMTQRG